MDLELLRALALGEASENSEHWRRQNEVWKAWYAEALKSKGTDLVGLMGAELRALRNLLDQTWKFQVSACQQSS